MPASRSKTHLLVNAPRQAQRDSEVAPAASVDQPYDDIVLLASILCDTPAAAIVLIDHGRPWPKAQIGRDYMQCPRAQAICDAALANPTQLLVIEDVAADARFAATLVRPGLAPLRFFAGMPLLRPDGYPVGILCAMDVTPRQFSTQQRACLQALARQTHRLFEWQRYAIEQHRLLSEREAITQRLEHARAELDQHRQAGRSVAASDERS
jgi:GAF domain-containing protein